MTAAGISGAANAWLLQRPAVEAVALRRALIAAVRPGGRLQFADIENGKEVPAGALRDIDLWTN